MPLFYNTSSPTPSTKNTINSITTNYGIRDFLLNKNLLPIYPSISTTINGSPHIGEPVLDTSINGNSNRIPFGLPLETEGLFRYEIAVINNRFKTALAPSLTNIEDVTTTQGIFGDKNFPQGIDTYPTSATDEISDYGLLGKTDYANFRKKATLYNLYLDSTKQIDVADWITLQPAGFTQQVGGYLDEYGSLNLGGSNGIQALNVIGSVLNGQGLGLAKGGVVTNFDIRSSLAGRVLGATGAIKDSKLGMIGGQQLALALANNAAFNAEQIILGKLNAADNILSLVKGGPLPGLRPDYKITVPSTVLGKIADYTERILGFTIPRSFLGDSGSIFSSENQDGNIQRANAMLVNTGRGQLKSLISNVFSNVNGTGQYDNPNSSAFRSGYVPGYTNSKGELQVNPTLYAFYDDATKGTILNLLIHASGSTELIPTISYNRSAMVKEYGFLSPEDTFTTLGGNSGYDNRKISDIGFSWNTSTGGLVNSIDNPNELPQTDKKSLLAKTQKLFNSKGMLNIVTKKGDMKNTTHSSQIVTANGNGISKGSAVISGSRFINGVFDGQSEEADNTYCRSWTTLNRYDSVANLIRNSGMTETSKLLPYRFQTENSTLERYGFPKIVPYRTDKNTDSSNGVVADPKHYMFSLENLAWSDNIPDLPSVEVGMGDLLTGKKGRLMWFPPYNIQFNETSSVNWETNNFIGRGESIYTYNNTERSGNLSFSIVVDHPSYINSFRNPNGPDDNYVASFFAGCIDPSTEFSNKLTVSEKSSIQESLVIETQTATAPEETVPSSTFAVYFPNDTSKLEPIFSLGYENGTQNGVSPDTIDYTTPSVEFPNGNTYGVGFGIGPYVGGVTSNSAWPDNTNNGLNGWKKILRVGDSYFTGFTDTNYITSLATYLDEKCPHCIVYVKSYASPHGTVEANDKLANGRTATVIEYFKANLYPGKSQSYKDERIKGLPNHPITYGETKCPKPQPNSPNADNYFCKVDRRTEVSFVYDPKLAQKELIQPKPMAKNQRQQINSRLVNKLYNEGTYFEQLTDKDKFVFDSFREKIKYFHPAFHSTTPEGLNSRLTFLQQCTRQGPTLENKNANNLAFGRAPVCILRIGDFYNTKIIIDNMTIDYEPLVWDLNPEGIGVQPMIANVNLSFKFIGGSTLMGPINKLQNALSFNYYANSHVYDPRADYIIKSEANPNTKPWKLINGETSLVDNSAFTWTDITTINLNNNTVDQIKDAESTTNANSPQQSGSEPSVVIDDSNLNVNVVANTSIIRTTTNNVKQANGLINITLTTETGFTNSYDVKVTLYDNACTPNPLTGGNIEPNNQNLLLSPEVSLGKDFVFNANTPATYQLKIDIVNLRSFTIPVTF